MLPEQAYLDLYPDAKLGDYTFTLSYSGKFRGYNANVRKRGRQLEFSLSKQWKGISEDVQIGLMQHLMNRILKTKKNTMNMDLYELFLKKVHIAVPKTKTHPVLEASFKRMNEEFFHGTMEQPNLEWGGRTYRKFGQYEYGTDTITMSETLLQGSQRLLDYVMYHEMLHKKHKFTTKNGRSTHHSRAFLEEEARFPEHKAVEQELSLLARRNRWKLHFF